MSTEIITTRLFDDVEQRVYDALNMVQSGVGSPEQWLIDALGGGSKSASGAYVNYDSVMGIPTANRSVNMIAGHIGAMPKEVRLTLPSGGHKLLPQSPAFLVSNRFCNDLQSCFTMWQTMMSHALLLGNGRAYIDRDGNGSPSMLTPMMPNTSYTIVIDGDKFHVTYFTQDMHSNVLTASQRAGLERWSTSNSNSGGNGYQYTIPDEHVFHIPGIGYNGMWGYPLTILAKDSFGVEMSGLDAVSYQFSNGGRPGLLITAPKGMLRTEKEAREFMAQFANRHEGQQNTGRTGLMREGMTATAIDASPADGGLKDLRDYSADEIALLFGTEYLLGQTSAVYKDLPDRFTAYVTNTLNQWMETIEQEAERKLLTRQQVRKGQYFHLDASALLRGNPNNIADYSGKLRTQGLISGNEGREMHGFNPVPELTADYGNPNTSSPDDEQDETEAEPEKPEQDEEESTAATALVYNFKSLIEYEKRRISHIAQKDQQSSDRIVAITNFYDGFSDLLTTTCRDLSVDESKSTIHVEKSKSLITEVLGTTDGNQVENELVDLVSDWQHRAGEFANV